MDENKEKHAIPKSLRIPSGCLNGEMVWMEKLIIDPEKLEKVIIRELENAIESGKHPTRILIDAYWIEDGTVFVGSEEVGWDKPQKRYKPYPAPNPQAPLNDPRRPQLRYEDNGREIFSFMGLPVILLFGMTRYYPFPGVEIIE